MNSQSIFEGFDFGIPQSELGTEKIVLEHFSNQCPSLSGGLVNPLYKKTLL